MCLFCGVNRVILANIFIMYGQLVGDQENGGRHDF